MIEFLTLFLGLTTGIHTVHLTVAGPVASVEVLLDGEMLATLNAAPWIFDCDLGDRPLPHDLVAIARDAHGQELDRAEQWINMAVHRRAATLAVDTDEQGRARSLRIDWQSIGEPEPEQIAATFDGRPLDVTDPDHIPLPAHDGREFHYVSADVEFSEAQRERRETELAGVRTQRISTQLTAVAVALKGRASLPPAGRMRSWFLKDGVPLEIHGVEKGLMDLFVVRAPGAQDVLDELARTVFANSYTPDRKSPALRHEWDPATFFAGVPETVDRRIQAHHATLTPLSSFAPFSHKLRLRFVSSRPGSLTAAGIAPEIFLHSRTYAGSEGGLSWLAQRQPPMRFVPRTVEAVALAGMRARAGNRRRAVLLISAAGAADTGKHSPADARELLRALQVPLYVWSFGTPDPGWGNAFALGDLERPMKAARRLERATAALQRDLKRQRVVWLKGRHLPQQIELGDEASGVRLAGS